MSWKGFSTSAPTLSLEDVNKEKEALSAEQLEQLECEMHGTMTHKDQTSSKLDASLNELRKELNLIPVGEKIQYLQALERCPSYVNDPEFRLMFLRSDEFDAKAAARRMVTYWESKVSIFGEDKAFGPITAEIVSSDDDTALRKGGVRILPKKASGDRGVIVIDRSRFDQRPTSRNNMIRLIWYIHHVALEDRDIQENGLVYIAGSPRRKTTLQEQDRKLDSLTLRHVRTAIPVHVCVIHHYLSSKILEYVVPVLMVLFGPVMRQRYIPHLGSEDSFLKALESYGITKDILPKDLGGTDDFNYDDWLEDRLTRGV